jgi:hypothetical protein
MRTKQRLTRILIQEVVIDLDDSTNEAYASHVGRSPGSSERG